MCASSANYQLVWPGGSGGRTALLNILSVFVAERLFSCSSRSSWVMQSLLSASQIMWGALQTGFSRSRQNCVIVFAGVLRGVSIDSSHMLWMSRAQVNELRFGTTITCSKKWTTSVYLSALNYWICARAWFWLFFLIRLKVFIMSLGISGWQRMFVSGSYLMPPDAHEVKLAKEEFILGEGCVIPALHGIVVGKVTMAPNSTVEIMVLNALASLVVPLTTIAWGMAGAVGPTLIFTRQCLNHFGLEGGWG